MIGLALYEDGQSKYRKALKLISRRFFRFSEKNFGRQRCWPLESWLANRG